MLFNSFEFIFAYLPTVFVIFFILAKHSRIIAALWLAMASLFFYGWWNPKFISLLAGSIIFNYSAAFLIGHTQASYRKLILYGAVVANLLLLAVFKYTNFFIASLNDAGMNFVVLDIVLPAGISFFTFTQIAFLVDTFRGVAKEYNFLHYVLFVTWFPHLIAGPVLHHKQMMPQFSCPESYRINIESISVGLTLFSIGLFKKVVLADNIAIYATPLFDGAGPNAHPMFAAAWVGSLAYGLQLYFDFSGYSDMAIGLSRIFNIKLPLNFNSPYKSPNIIEFWRRWHITLSNFLRDYLYFSLGGNKKGRARRYTNLMLTMVLGGLWHGAGWTFIVWGTLHGCYLIINHAWNAVMLGRTAAQSTLGRIASTLLTFAAVIFAWVPFRAKDMASALEIWAGMLGLNGVSLPTGLESKLGGAANVYVHFHGLLPGIPNSPAEALIWISIGLAVVWLFPNSQQWLAPYAPAWDTVEDSSVWPKWKPSRWHGAAVGLTFASAVILFTKNSQFLYFQF